MGDKSPKNKDKQKKNQSKQQDKKKVKSESVAPIIPSKAVTQNNPKKRSQ
jgi:hypothetical protein